MDLYLFWVKQDAKQTPLSQRRQNNIRAAYIADAGIVDGGESSNNVVLYHNNAVN
ncbi:15658_t:CDS:2, partial [Entrophospora sp. SA101]